MGDTNNCRVCRTTCVCVCVCVYVHVINIGFVLNNCRVCSTMRLYRYEHKVFLNNSRVCKSMRWYCCEQLNDSSEHLPRSRPECMPRRLPGVHFRVRPECKRKRLHRNMFTHVKHQVSMWAQKPSSSAFWSMTLCNFTASCSHSIREQVQGLPNEARLARS